jgi:hypothetical protein
MNKSEKDDNVFYMETGERLGDVGITIPEMQDGVDVV